MSRMPGASCWAWRRALAALLPLGVAGCGADVPATVGKDLNVLLITLDTTRADYLGSYGREQADTPTLDRLATEGARFEQAISTAGLTPMAHASILTGMNPYRHGLRVFHGAPGHRLPDHVPSLATLLQRSRWRTGAFVSSYPVSEAYGLDQGFETFDTGIDLSALDLTQQQSHDSEWAEVLANSTQRRGDATTDRALDWLGGLPADDRWFLWVHYFDAHDYSLVPPGEFAAPRGADYEALRRRSATASKAAKLAMREKMYDIEITWMDQQVQRLLDQVQQQGERDRTVIVVVADHGQGLSDGLKRHGWRLHRLIYEWSIRVPLLLVVPGEEPGVVVSEPVRSIDLVPTLLTLLDLPVPEIVQGKDLLPLLRGEADAEPRIAYADALNLEDSHAPLKALPEHSQDNLFCVRQGRWKLIHHGNAPEQSELYDLQTDPGEEHNVLAEQPQVVRGLRAWLEKEGALSWQEGDVEEESAAMQRALDALGYTSGAGEDH